MENIIVNLRPLEDAGSLRATASVSLNTAFGMLTIHQFKVIQKTGDEPWVKNPQISYKKSDGTWRHLNVLEFPYLLQNKIREEILRALTENE